MLREHRCPECDAVIPPYAPEGLCLKCIMRHGLDGDTDHTTSSSARTKGERELEAALIQGTRLGVFEIGDRLGTGGQGEVYRAHDTKLGRYVAVKILPAKFLDDPMRLARFEREARVLASLNHPNVGALYELREEAGLQFLVLELVEGETLADRITRGPIPVNQAIRIGIQIAEGLEAAHERGVVHRDLKPANIMLSEKGGVKILDFGIAKALESTRPRVSGDDAFSPTTMSDSVTGGLIVGTPAYMSPEQRLGATVDQRADIWAFGKILHEMLTGRHSYQADRNQADSGIIVDGGVPTLTGTSLESPSGLARLLDRTLQMRPEDRYSNVSDVLTDLRALQADWSANAPTLLAEDRAVPSIAVLPLVNVDGESANEYFSDGLTEELICGLSKVPGLHVAARSSAFRFRGQDLDVREIGKRLGVGNVLEGSVRRAGNRLRATVKLVSTTDGYHLWSEKYDRELNDVFAVQEEIAVAVVEHLKSEILEEDKSHLSRRHTSSLEAHDLYLKGRYHLNAISYERLTKAIGFFQRAIQEDPAYASAYAGLTDCYCLLGIFGLIDPKDAVPEARTNALKALALDETLAEVHHALGLVKTFCGEWSAARAEFKRAIERQPDHAFGRACHAMYLRFTTDKERALSEMKLALLLEPHSVQVNAGAAYLQFSLRAYDDAIKQSQKILAMAPDFFQAHGYLAFAYARKEMFQESVAEWCALLSQRGYERIAWGVQRAFARTGYKGAIKVVAQRSAWAYYLVRTLRWIPGKNPRFCSPMLPAVLYAEAGEKDLAFKWLNKAIAQRTPLMIGITEDPPWDGLRSDPRFAEIIGRIAESSELRDR